MIQEHGEKWPEVFASLAMKVVKQHTEGQRTAFSNFQHNETKRCLAGEVALNVPYVP